MMDYESTYDMYQQQPMFQPPRTSTLIRPEQQVRNSSIAWAPAPSSEPSPKESSDFITDRCSPRCKMGILGFVIGLLLISIVLSVVLVLYLKQ